MRIERGMNMNKRIKPGMYVRTKYGIAQVKDISIKNECYELDKDIMLDHEENWKGTCTYKQIQTFSNNILDLLEKGDIFLTASGGIHKVEYIQDGFIRDIGFAVSKDTTRVIKAIMTKEQFEKMAYKVGEE